MNQRSQRYHVELMSHINKKSLLLNESNKEICHYMKNEALVYYRNIDVIIREVIS